ncbi:leucine-rich melanocyte differentiation-associated protein-like [Agrilus planipennis]|uniref:Leucine-rich melanocyte differentiation-associated protein-like n=1 Tax=Agrilus planipennis TaxID=224129 RepID=A0A1W4XM89_AGRPL|nr:leucine-rich melanocyte differentiation-associated protein-like [Agrilus planipennis]
MAKCMYYVIYRLPHLQFLDSTKVTNFERMQAQVKGRYTNIVRPKNSPASEQYVGSPILYALTPLPRNFRKPEEHQGAFGKLTYHYSGKQSEGNRFILNNDL